jgi:glycosyltransferase involved in cell wall biosynthesis
VLSWWEAVKKEATPAKWNIYKQKVRSGISAADVVIAPSKTMLEEAEKIYGPIKHKKVIYNGALQSKYISANKEKYVFSMGRIWDEAKNIKLVLKAAKEIKYPIYIAGDNAGMQQEEEEKNVNFLGYLPPEEVIKWLSRASVYVLPVIYEPFGYTFVEAAFAGCALVTGNISSMQEIWDDAASFVDPNDEKALAINVNQLIENETFRQTMASKARRTAKEKYSIEKMLSEYKNVYKNVVSPKVKPKSYIKTSKKKVVKI